MSKVTDLAAVRAAQQRPVSDACRWSEAFEKVAATNMRIAFAWQRIWLRALLP